MGRVITDDLSSLQRLAVVVFFVPMAMWFIGWFVPHVSDKGAEDGVATEEDARKTRAIARWLRRAAVAAFLVGLLALVLAA